MRRVSTRVLPDPAPARMHSGWIGLVTARRWVSSSPSSSVSTSTAASVPMSPVRADGHRTTGGRRVDDRSGSDSSQYSSDVAFPRKLLNTNEELVLDLRPHWLYLAGPTLALAASVILGIVSVAGEWPDAAKVAVGVVVVVIAPAGSPGGTRVWTTTNFVLTSDRSSPGAG